MDEVTENGIARSKRDEAPAAYILKIDSFTELCDVLKNADIDKYESPQFKAGKYKWRLVLHPCGDKEMNEKDHISLYLEIADTKAIPAGGFVCAVFKLFVYDQSRDKYLTIHDGRVRRFHGTKTKHGFHQLLPMATFKDPTNGYLVGNCCEFGAELHIIKVKNLATVERQKLSFEKNPACATYRWKLREKFRFWDVEQCQSPVFPACDRKWSLVLRPERDEEKEVQHLSLFLCLECIKDLSKGERLYLEFDLFIKKPRLDLSHRHLRSETIVKQQHFSTFLDGDIRPNWGGEKLIPVRDLRKWYKCRSLRFLKDTAIFEVKITIISRIEALENTERRRDWPSICSIGGGVFSPSIC